jgi:hypothetical protein
MDEIKKQTLCLCAALIAAPRLQFLDESPFALREVLAESILKAETLLRQVEARYPGIRVAGREQ